jgi:hypothetical protein
MNPKGPKPKVPALTIADVKVIRPVPGAAKVIVVCRVPITDMNQASAAIRLLNSVELKEHVYNNRHELGLASYGIERFGSHRPYTEKKTYEHGGTVDGYEQEFRFTRGAG